MSYIAYDPLSRMTSQTDRWVVTASFAYDGAGNLSSLPLGNGIVQGYAEEPSNMILNTYGARCIIWA